ncbi:hypothetical protein KFE25_011845 [Diacronema lutheri]|uniref:Uncharacterized protein n=1 Tax=Diacronema lutheri TaxID=2081491 RepID=A0A8J5XGH4_DIALT|nr:hypothetical protein KFE25_011845 [Diacronema lutheri]
MGGAHGAQGGCIGGAARLRTSLKKTVQLRVVPFSAEPAAPGLSAGGRDAPTAAARMYVLAFEAMEEKNKQLEAEIAELRRQSLMSISTCPRAREKA